MHRFFVSGIMLLLVAVGAIAQTAPAKDAGELTKLLNEFLAGASRNDAAVHDRFWAEDVIYTGSAGRRRGKADIMRDVRSAHKCSCQCRTCSGVRAMARSAILLATSGVSINNKKS